jgi:hypothetical protein
MVTKFLVGKPEEKKSLGILTHRWNDNIKVYYQGTV